MSNFMTFTLRQHTPLLHFQHQQEGATLRATEVKPRLDAFLRSRYADPYLPAWLVGKEKAQHPDALDYKLWISSAETPLVEKIKTYGTPKTGSYFGNDKGLTWSKGLTLTFSSFETGVLDLIYQNLAAFFVLHNFGQRQSKGFGSFTVSHVNGVALKGYGEGPFSAQDAGQVLLHFHPKFYRLKSDTTTPLQRIHEEYQVLKAGKNHGGYQKSKLFRYFIERPNPIRWEKRIIKQRIGEITAEGNSPFRYPLLSSRSASGDNRQDDGSQPESYRYIRALLGLAETNEYLVDDRQMGRYLVRITHQPEAGQPEIERLASPILFKVIDGAVYLIPLKIDPVIFGKSFRFSVSARNGPQNERDLVILRTPDAFDLPDFLNKHLGNAWTLLS